MLCESGAFGCAADDVGEDRRLQPLALEPAEDGRVRRRFRLVAELGELAGERRRERLAARLAALAAADKQRRALFVEVEAGPVECDQLGAAKPGLQKREKDKPVALGQFGPSPWRRRCSWEQLRELVRCQPIGFLLRLRRRLELEERIGRPLRRLSQRRKRRRRPNRR